MIDIGLKKEINHKYNNLIGSQFLDPVQVEAGTYCFRKSIFLKEKSRILKQNLFLKLTISRPWILIMKSTF